jgi:hypothetical protein
MGSMPRVFGTGPFEWFLNATRLRGRDQPRLARRVVLSVLVAWVPLLILAQLQGLAIGTGSASLLQDFAAYSRFLLAVPLMVLAEGQSGIWLHRVLDHFVDAHVVPVEAESEYRAFLDSTERLLESRVMLAAVVLLAYALTLASSREWIEHGAASWILVSGGTEDRLSYAGWWRLLVSQPLFMMLVLTWFWRLFLWSRCMWTLARMDLRIVASHPDRAGGLAFVGQSLRAFPILALALGSAIAGTLANLVIYDNRTPHALTPVVVVTAVLILLISAGPLLVFVRPLREAQDDAELTYGALAAAMGMQLEGKWLPRAHDLEAKALEVPDFSSTTDLYSVVAGVRDMKPIPIELKDFAPLLIATLIPFLPIILRQVSFAELLNVARHLLM